MAKLSEEAQEWLEYFASRPDKPINSAALRVLGIPRRKSKKIMSELLKNNALKRIRYASGGSRLIIADGTTVVPSGNTVKQYNHSASTAIVPIAVQLEMKYIATNKFLDGVKEGDKSMGYEFFSATSSEDSEALSERQKHEARKKTEYKAARQKKDEARDLRHRSKIDPMEWTCKDVAYEFSNRLQDFWDIAPMSVTRTRFVQALATFRRQHDTNGAIELELVKIFFENLRSEKIKDGNHAWRAFMFKAPMMLQTARERVVTPEQIETAIIDDTARADRKLSLLDEDDNV